MGARGTLLASLLLLASSGCSDETPREGFEAFFAAAAAQDGDAAWQRLSLESRAVLEDLAGRAHAQGRGKGGARDWLFGVGAGAGLPLTTTLRGVAVIEQEGDRALVEVHDALGQKERVRMVREEGRWRIDLVAQARRGASP